MPSPFPGMNPYLEQPAFWSEFHSRLIVAIANTIAPRLRPNYYVSVETRTYLDEPNGELLVGIPDAVVRLGQNSNPAELTTSGAATAIAVPANPRKIQLSVPVEVTERYLQVREVRSNIVITVIEILSPKHKRGGEGRESYLAKRQVILGSQSHLVEIDLLRAYQPMPSTHSELADYRILVSSSEQRPIADLYEFSLQMPIPNFPLPLKPGDTTLIVNLQALVDEVYEQASYDLRIDYSQPVPPPALSEANQQWVQAQLGMEIK